MKINNHYELEQITQETAKENALQEVEFCSGLYNGYFVNLEPYYGISLLVYDNETHRLILDELGIHCNHHCKTELDFIEAEEAVALKKLFNSDRIRNTPPASWQEQCDRQNFALNIYPKRYKYISGFYIREPDEEQKEAAKGWYFSLCKCAYFEKAEERDEVDSLWDAAKQQHAKRFDDFEYLKNAMIYEFYNFECMYSERYDEALANIGLDLNSLSETQEKAFWTARREFWKQVDEREDW